MSPVEVAPRELAHTDHAGRACRGWALAARRPGLTEAESLAGVGHVSLCRRCRDQLAAVERTRAQLLGGSAGAAAGIAATQLVPLGGTAAAGGLGALVTGKVAAGVVAVMGAAVLATGGTAVVVDKAQHERPVNRPMPAVGEPASQLPAPQPSTAAPSSIATPTSVPGPRVTVPTKGPADVPTLQRPTLPVPLPTLPTVPALPLPFVSPLESALDDLLDGAG